MHVLIVDDEPVIRTGLKKIVSQLGPPIMTVHLAENGEDALAYIAEHSPDLVLTDIRMPRMDGLELCRRLSQLESEIPIIVISGYHDFEYAQKCLSYGVKEYVLKPVNKGKLHEVLLKQIAKLQKRRATAKLSELDVEGWLEQTVDAIWLMDEPRLIDLLAQLRQDLDGTMPESRKAAELMQRLLGQLVKQLQAKDFTPQAAAAAAAGAAMAAAGAGGGAGAGADSDGDDPSDFEAAFEAFRVQVVGMLTELRLKRKGKAKDPIEEAKEYIERNLSKEVSLEEVADMLGFNPSYFSQLFKLTTNETFVQFRIRRRMELAKRLLEQPQHRIVDISYDVGYADHAHFTKTFKKYAGCSPSEYRQKLGIE
ncbi:response regulator transcription factor [Paenibacillus koleovorans]|uniref:response regulator transcription factor n=1 Tax=Paenibacillus koleovorans TaxID=121608 RepID=UPI000FD8C4C1|nr:response regulator [Paenibacillus koleovorans]